jgi:hypothetical protein
MEKKNTEDPDLNDIFTKLDNHFSTDYFSVLYADNEKEMDNMQDERLKVAFELLHYEIQYALTLPGKIIATNSDLQNEGALTWKIDLFRFLADDYTLAAESRAANVWAFVVTLLLVIFSAYCFVIVLKRK